MNTQIILNGQFELDSIEDANILLTFQCGDIRNVLSRNSAYSKTLSIIGSANNNQAFNYLFDVRSYSDFNPNKRASVLVKSGGIVIFEGILKVDSIKVTNTNLISYECSMYSNVNDLFTELSTLKLNDLDFSEFNHAYSKENVVGSWDDFIIYNGQQTPVRKGFGYVYPYIDLGVDGSLTNIKYTEFFKPSFYVKTVLDKVFSQTDYKYKSDFFNSDYFKSLIFVPSPTSFTLPDLTITNSQLWASQESDDTDIESEVLTTYTNNFVSPSSSIAGFLCQSQSPQIYNSLLGTPSLILQNTTVGGRYDTGHNYNTSTGIYTVPVTGYYNFTANFNLDVSISNDTYSANATIPQLHISSQHRFNAWLQVTGGTLNQYGVYPVSTLQNALVLKNYDSYITQNDQLIGSPNNDAPNFNFDSGVPYFLNAGDMVSIRISDDYKLSFISEAVPQGSYDFKPRIELVQVTPSDLKIQLMDNLIHEGMPWTFKNILSTDQCNDFILSLSKMFNLYFELDSTEENTLVIEPRQDFYNGYVIDWTSKLDRSNEVEITPMSEISSKNLHFLYRNDSDYWNNKYQTENLSTNKFSLLSQLTYGEFTYHFDNDFVDQASEDKIDLIFGPTPLVQDGYYTSITGGTYSSSTKVISTAYQEQYDNTTGNITKTALNSFAPRILFYNGLVNCDSWGMYDFNQVQNKATYASLLSIFSGETWDFVDFTHNTLTQYPYAGHLDNPYTPTEDLNFNYPAEYFYNRSNVTNSNLFNKFWFEAVQDMEDTSAKLITGYFKLDTADIQSLSFRNIIYLDGSYWIINQIIDYSPLENTLTKIELLKMINYNSTKKNITSTQQSINH